MGNEYIYDGFNNDEGLRLPSYMAIFPRSNSYHFSQKELEKDLGACKDFMVVSIQPYVPEEEEDNNAFQDFEVQAVIIYKKIEYSFLIYAIDAKQFDLSTFSFANTIDNESLRIAQQQPFALSTKIFFDVEDPLESFLFQLKVLHAIMPQASLVVDFSSYKLLSPFWLEMTAESNIPPSPNYLYIIHAVYDKEENGEAQYWMHTHGLHRCGAMELEVVNIKSGAQQMFDLLNTTANLFIWDFFKENEPFQVGYDGLGIHLCWQRWEEALKTLPKNTLGGFDDRIEEDGDYNVHSEPSGILFAVEDGHLISPEIYASTLADNPIFLVKEEETLRMSALAKKRFDLFKKAFETYGEKKEEKKGLLKKLFNKSEDNPKWNFHIKLGLITDEAEDENDREHLWFEVLAIDEKNNLTGKLLNQPYWIEGLNENDIKTFPVFEVLTDWTIDSPTRNYTPDSIYLLRQDFE